MDYDQLFKLVERLRKEAIGVPQWIEKKQVYEYQEESAKVVAVLKLIRATHGITALAVLCRAGLFIDFGSILRGVHDAVSEIYFLLENYPQKTENQEQFIKGFFEGTIDGHLKAKTPMVPTQKIRSAMSRFIKGRHDHETREQIERVFKAFSSYVHSEYASTMEVYNGAEDDFNVTGVPSEKQKRMRMALVETAAVSVLHGAASLSGTLGLTGLNQEIMQHV